MSDDKYNRSEKCKQILDRIEFLRWLAEKTWRENLGEDRLDAAPKEGVTHEDIWPGPDRGLFSHMEGEPDKPSPRRRKP